MVVYFRSGHNFYHITGNMPLQKLDIEYIPFVTLTETRGNSVYIEGIPFDDRDTFLNLDVETPQSDTFTIRIHFIIEKRDFTSEGCELSPVLRKTR